MDPRDRSVSVSSQEEDREKTEDGSRSEKMKLGTGQAPVFCVLQEMKNQIGKRIRYLSGEIGRVNKRLKQDSVTKFLTTLLILLDTVILMKNYHDG